MSSTSAKQRASIEMGWLQWWNPLADQSGKLSFQRLDKWDKLALCCSEGSSAALGAEAVLWGAVCSGADGQYELCGVFQPCCDGVVLCLVSISTAHVMFIQANRTIQGLGQIIFQWRPHHPAVRTVAGPGLARVSSQPPKQSPRTTWELGLACAGFERLFGFVLPVLEWLEFSPRMWALPWELTLSTSSVTCAFSEAEGGQVTWL